MASLDTFEKLSQNFSPLSDITDLRHQSSVMCIIMLGGGGDTRGLQGVGSQVRKNKIKFLSSNKISEIQHKKYLALLNSLRSVWLTRTERSPFKDFFFNFP